MPPYLITRHRIDDSVYLRDWIAQFLCLDRTAHSFPPRTHFDVPKVVKVVSVERIPIDDGTYRLKNGIQVVVADSDHRCFAVIQPQAIRQYERKERERITKGLLNIEIAVSDLHVVFISQERASRAFDFKTTGHDTVPRQYATMVIDAFEVLSRDRYIPRDVEMIPFVYKSGRYKTRFFQKVEDLSDLEGNSDDDNDAELKSM